MTKIRVKKHRRKTNKGYTTVKSHLRNKPSKKIKRMAKKQNLKIDTPSIKKEQKIEIPKLQKRLSNGQWSTIPEGKKREYFNFALEKQQYIAKEFGENTPNTDEKLLEALQKKREIQFGDDWYDQIRIKPTKAEKEAEKEWLSKQFEKSERYQREEEKRFYEQVGKYDEM